MRKKLILVLIFLLFSFLLFAQSKQEDRVLKVGIESDIDVFSPWDSTFTTWHKILWNMFETLVTLEEKSTKIKPYLATSWEASNNNRIWTFILREGVKFHDGSSLTADDVVASASVFQEFEGRVEKIDRLTVRFTIPEPNSSFLNKLVELRYAIAPSQIVQQYKTLRSGGRLKDFEPVGSGPFRLLRHERGRQIILNSFTDYWQGSPWLRSLTYQIIPNNKARLTALETGEIDVVDILFPTDIPQIKNNSRLKIIDRYGMNICYLSMNTTRRPFDNKMIRQAINLAVDKFKLNRMFNYGGYGVPTNRILSPAFWGFSALPSPGRYMPAAAKRMLKEAGYNTNTIIKLVCVPRARPYLPDPKGVAEEITKQLTNIDMKVNITIPANFTEFNSILRRGDYHLVLFGWIELTGDPDFILTSILSGKEYVYNNARWHNNLFDNKLQAARELPLTDVRGRIRLYNEAQMICQDESPLIPLFHTKIFVIHNREVMGIIFYPSSMISYHKVSFQP